MGILTKLLLAPVAPVAGVVWLAERLEEQALAIYHSPETVRAELDLVRGAHARGEITDTERDRLEESLLSRLLEPSDG
jgi:hypothetical protein